MMTNTKREAKLIIHRKTTIHLKHNLIKNIPPEYILILPNNIAPYRSRKYLFFSKIKGIQ